MAEEVDGIGKAKKRDGVKEEWRKIRMAYKKNLGKTVCRRSKAIVIKMSSFPVERDRMLLNRL